MTWRRVGVIYLVFASLGLYFILFERTSEPPRTAASPGAAERSLLGIDPDAVRAVVFRREGLEVNAARDGGRWRVVGPLETSVQPDLIAAAVATLTAGQESEVMGEATGENLDDFGLAVPTSEVDVTLSDETGTRVRVLLGASNPTKTALYAKRADRPGVYLVGANLRYYEDLIFEAVAGRNQP
jgi:hypothetical protein